MEQFQAFCRREKEGLGVITGEEMDFLATHDAWRGYPRIHICQERIEGISGPILQGVIHHEMAHALHHGTPEFYTFRFSKRLQAAGNSHGLDFSRLQQCVYFLSVAIKDWEVVEWLARVGLGFSQIALLEYVVSDTEEERRAWDAVCDFPTLRKIALAAFLKTLLPIEVMITIGVDGAQALKIRWDKAYEWLSERDRGALSGLARYTMTCEGGAFQDRLEKAVLHLFTYA